MTARAVKAGNFVFVGGIGGLRNPKTGEVDEKAKGNIALQSKYIFEEMDARLKSFGSSLDNIVKLTIFTKDFDLLPAFREVREQYLKSPTASTAVQAGLMEGISIEVDAIAIIPEQ